MQEWFRVGLGWFRDGLGWEYGRSQKHSTWGSQAFGVHKSHLDPICKTLHRTSQGSMPISPQEVGAVFMSHPPTLFCCLTHISPKKTQSTCSVLRTLRQAGRGFMTQINRGSFDISSQSISLKAQPPKTSQKEHSMVTREPK